MATMYSFKTRNHSSVLLDLDKIIAADFGNGKIVVEGGKEFNVRLGFYEYNLLCDHSKKRSGKNMDKE